MRIVHLITRLIVGGAQENTILSCEGLHARGHQVFLLTGPTTGPEGSLVERARRGGYTCAEVPDLIRSVQIGTDLSAIRSLTRRFRELVPDVVHTHSSKAGVVGRIAARRARVPVVVHTIHGMSFNRTQWFPVRAAYAMAERFCAKRCQAIICVAEAMREQALAHGIGRPMQYKVIRSGIEVHRFDASAKDAASVRRAWGLLPEHIVVGTVARLFRNKGYEQLINVIARTVPEEPRLRFVWIGDGADRDQYVAELERRGLRDRVILTGLVPPDEMPGLLAGIDLLAHTSRWEGLPRAVVQALLMGKPAVSFAIDGAPEVVIPGETGELAPLDNIRAFADGILRLAADANLRSRYGAAGRERCLREFSHHTMVKQLERVYEKLLSDETPQ